MASNDELFKDKALTNRLRIFQDTVDRATKLGIILPNAPIGETFAGSKSANKFFKELAGNTTLIDQSVARRAMRGLGSQTGSELVQPVLNWYDQYKSGNPDPSSALKQIYGLEAGLRKPASTGTGSGTEAHHQIALSTFDRVRNLPVNQQLEIFSRLRSEYGIPVGTYPEEMLMLSSNSHQKDKRGVTAHTDPIKFIPGVDSAVNQGFWKADPFEPGISTSEAIDRLLDESIRPQMLMNRLAYNRQDEANGRNVLNQIAGGDLWVPDMKIRKQRAQQLEAAGKSGVDIDINRYINENLSSPAPKASPSLTPKPLPPLRPSNAEPEVLSLPSVPVSSAKPKSIPTNLNQLTAQQIKYFNAGGGQAGMIRDNLSRDEVIARGQSILSPKAVYNSKPKPLPVTSAKPAAKPNKPSRKPTNRRPRGAAGVQLTDIAPPSTERFGPGGMFSTIDQLHEKQFQWRN